MPVTFKMPKLSPTMNEGTIVKWHKHTGDYVNAGDVLMEVATDKATVEYNALDAGWLRQILIKEGEEAVVNQAIAVLTEDQNESIDNYKPEGIELKAAAAITSEPVESPNEESKKDIPQTQQPFSRQFIQAAFAPEAPLENYTFEYPTERIEGRIFASPLARKIAHDKGLDLSTVKGSGPNGRIVEKDLVRAQPLAMRGMGVREKPSIPPGTYIEESMTPMQKVIAQRLQDSKASIPHFYVQRDIDAENLNMLYEQLKSQNIKVTFNDFVLRATALALREHPDVNSGFNSTNQTIVRFKTIDICVAVKVGEGLITPIVRHADHKRLGELSAEVRDLATRAREGKLIATEYKGGSFTISNLGMYGITAFQAIINPPQAAILAVGAVLDRVVIKEGQIKPGKMMTLTLSSDHRVVDGVAAAKFLETLRRYLESPAFLLL